MSGGAKSVLEGGVGDAFDVIVIGAGPGGYVAAIRAAQLGLKTAVVERDKVGGICLNWGCIPTKSLLRSSELYHLIGRADDFGISVSDVTFDLKKIVTRSRQVAGQLSDGINYLLKKNAVTLIQGDAQFADKNTLKVRDKDGEHVLHADSIIVATGARPRLIPGIEGGSENIWSYFDTLQATSVPKSLLVIGTGAIGVEFASFFNTLGAKTTIVEMQDRILPSEDAEISAAAHAAFAKQGMAVHTATRVTSITSEAADQIIATLEHSSGARERVAAEKAIVAIGIVANLDGLGLDGIGVEIANGHIVTGAFGESSVDGIYAIGDCAGAPWLAHKASHEGMICAERIAGKADIHPLDVSNIPGCTYCWPQIASIGFTEQAAKDEGFEVKVGKFPLAGNGKAVALGETDGFVKTVFDARTGELLGAHIIGAEATELIQGFVIARTLEATQGDLQHVVFPHPTLSEALHEAALQADNRAIHI
jgi:dihydrolipoamide dehydrogenase